MINTPLTQKTQLIDYFALGAKPSDQLMIGTEHERFLYDRQTGQRAAYEGPYGIEALLKNFFTHGFTPHLDRNHVVAVRNNQSQTSLTLEPGGQFELSGAPVANLHETFKELKAYEANLHYFLDSFNLMDLTVGFDPFSSRDQVPWMPKQRYAIMREYMPQKGRLGLDMMLRTCTVQVNLDYVSEEDMVKKYRVAMALQPFVATLFASSPFKEGHFSGLNSFRNYVWQDTDPDRCGFLKFVFDENMGYERYVDYLLSVPMYFVYRNGTYINAAGLSFKDFMAGTLSVYPHHYPLMKDWEDQTTITFPEVRLKQYLELRSADCGPTPLLMALPALWVGLLYDQKNLDDLHERVMEWSLDHLEEVYLKAPYHGFMTIFQGKSISNLLAELVEKAKEGLKRRHILDSQSQVSEEVYVHPLEVLLKDNMNLSDYLQAYYRQHESMDFMTNRHFWFEVEQWLQGK